MVTPFDNGNHDAPEHLVRHRDEERNEQVKVVQDVDSHIGDVVWKWWLRCMGCSLRTFSESRREMVVVEIETAWDRRPF